MAVDESIGLTPGTNGSMATLGADRPIRARSEIVIVALSFALFPLVAALEPGSAGQAMNRARSIAETEHRLGIAARPVLHAWSGEHDVIRIFADVVYYGAHVPALIGAGIWLARRRPARYRRLRSTFVAAHLVTLALYALVPTAPPRFLVSATPTPGAWRSVQYEFAAFPSGHVVFATVVGLALLGSTSVVIRVAGALYPVLVALITMATNNHFLVDVVAAPIIVGVCSLIASHANSRHSLSDGVNPKFSE